MHVSVRGRGGWRGHALRVECNAHARLEKAHRTYVIAFGITLLGRKDWVHHEVPLVATAMATVLPHVRVDCNVGIDQGVVEPFLAMPPIEVQKLDEEPVWNFGRGGI